MFSTHEVEKSVSLWGFSQEKTSSFNSASLLFPYQEKELSAYRISVDENK